MTLTVDIVEQPSFKTPDGKTFPSREEALSHLYRQKYIDEAKRYVEARSMTKINATRATNTIADYLAYRHLQEQAGKGATNG
jgi:hypothetical protein